MARQAQSMAKGTYNNAQGIYNTATGSNALHESNANQLYDFLTPQYESEAINPQGYGGPELSAMNTAVQQSTGGATAGAVGQNALTSQRTRNLGGMQTANNDSARTAAEINSQKALDIQGQDARLKEQQRQSGLSGLAGLHGVELDSALKDLGIANNSLNTENQSTQDYTNAGQSGWLQNTIGIINALGNLGKGAGAVGLGV